MASKQRPLSDLFRSRLRPLYDRFSVQATPTAVCTQPRGLDLSLTYDDGPTPNLTAELGRRLADSGHHATFFVLAPRARAYPEEVAKLVESGHEIALHGYDHRRLLGRPMAEVAALLRQAKADVEAVSGTRVSLFRPPFGAQNRRTYLATRRAGLRPVGWSVNSVDYLALSPAMVMNELRDRLRPGEIILLHDGDGDRLSAEVSPKFIDLKLRINSEIVIEMARQGLRSRPVGALIRRNGPILDRWLKGGGK